MPFTSKTPTYLTAEQRHELTQIPADLSDREIARYYTFTQKDLDLINQRRRHHNRLGFAVQLAVLRFPGRPLKDLAGVPNRVLAVIADQVHVPASAFSRYGDRDHTPYEHLDEIRREPPRFDRVPKAELYSMQIGKGISNGKDPKSLHERV